jgi:ABC-2 type transport system ATP-binding protein
MTLAAPVVEAEGLGKRYRATVAVDDFSLRVAPGEVVGLLGPNGAGKSTAVKMLVGLVAASTGTARLFGQPATDPEARRRVGYLPELFRFHEWMTGRQMLLFHARLAGMADSVAAAAIPAVLERVGMAHRADERIGAYSKGMTQRIGIAQALVADPTLVVLDEPTSALDPVGRGDVRGLIGQLRAEGRAVILNSHLLGEVERVCDRVVVLDSGRTVFHGPIDELKGGAHRIEVVVDRVDASLLADLRRFGQLTVEGETVLHIDLPDDALAADVAEAVVAAGRRLMALVPMGRTLEEAFSELVTGGDR